MEYRIEVQDQTLENTYQIDLYDNVDINVVYNIVDIREPDKRKTSHTKEIIIPATSNNDRIFSGLFELGFSVSSFNPNFKLNAVLYRGDEAIISGYLQVLEVVNGENGIGSYKVMIYGEVFTFFKDIENYNLSDLDLSQFNHLYERDEIKKSWTNSKGEGYVYPMEWRGKSDEDYEVEDFYPAIYVKQYIDSIFELSPMEYKSDFFSSDYFKSLIIPNTKDRLYLSEEEKTQLEFTARRETEYRIFDYDAEGSNLGRSFTKGVKWDGESDAGNIFFPSFYYRPTKKSEVKLTADMKLRLRYRIRPGIADGLYKVYQDEFTKATISIVRRRDGVDTIVGSEEYSFFFVDNTIVVSGGVGALVIEENFITQAETLVLQGDSFWVNIKMDIPGQSGIGSLFFNTAGQSVGGDIEMEVLTDSEFYNAAEDYLYEGGLVKMNQILPTDITCTDFVTSINKVFNLYWVPEDEKTIRIESRDNLYSPETNDVEILDWTYKIDRNSDMVITPLSELNYNKYLFKYQQDDDYYNKMYLDTNGEEYGSREIRVLNDFVNETYELNTIFSNSPMINLNDTDIVVPSIVELGEGGVFERYTNPNIRIHYWGGLKTTDFGWTFKSSSENDEEQIYYPYAGHLDDPYNPTEDLLFDMPKVLYWDWENYTQGNLYFKYWENTIIDLTDADSHLLKCKIKHNTLDIQELNLFDTIQIDNVYYVINKIEYNPLTNISDVELFKKKSFSVFKTLQPVGQQTLVEIDKYKEKAEEIEDIKEAAEEDFENIEVLEDEKKDVKKTEDPKDWREDIEDNKKNSFITRYGSSTYLNTSEKKKRTNIHRNFGSGRDNKERFVSVRGRDNNVGKQVYNVQVNGNDNNVPGSNTNIQINGNNNQIMPGVNNVTIIGDNQVATKSNTVIVNGVEISDNLQFNYSVNYYNGSINEVQNPFDSQNDVTNIICGINSVQNKDTSSPINYIDGGVDTNNDPLFTDLTE
jgi:hypothetical protein